MGVSDPAMQCGLNERHKAACDFIEKNLRRESLTPAMVAQSLGISVRQLHALFAPTGQSFSRYVLARRLELAREQLGVHPGRAVIDVALACGIKSSSVFYRAFREAFGMNPSDYRQSLRASAANNAGSDAPEAT